jgi:hypothetical protein
MSLAGTNWENNMRSYWPGKDWGYIYRYSGYCGVETLFNAWGPQANIDPQGTDGVSLLYHSCWLP